MFRSQLFDHLQGVVLRASAITTFSACLRHFIWYVSTSGMHTHRQHTATYQIKQRKQAEKVVIALARRTTP